MNFFKEDKLTALESIEYAQRIAFAPIVFQASLALRDLGILSYVEKAGKDGVTANEIVNHTKLSDYGVRVLVEAGLGIGLLTIQDDKYTITKTGYYLLQDEMTRVNMDFVQDICYNGMFDLTGSIASGKPTGLSTLGSWPTIYEGLAHLNPQQQKSWFSFDHFYSSDSFPLVLPHVFKDQPIKILDIGGNTGKWALKCAQFNPEVQVTICDLPGQLKMAEANIEKAGYSNRVSFHEINILDKNAPLPKGYDVIWMRLYRFLNVATGH